MTQNLTDLCNDALQLVGLPRISNITDDSPRARQCQTAYDGARRKELRANVWNFAKKRIVLSPESTTPAFDFAYQYGLPANCIRILKPVDDPYCDWVVEGRKILTNQGTSLNLVYVADIDTLSLWDPIFYETMGVAMALNMVEALTESTGKKQMLAQQYKESINEARKINAFEQLSTFAVTDSFLLARL